MRHAGPRAAAVVARWCRSLARARGRRDSTTQVSSMTSMGYMFYNAKVFNQDSGSWVADVPGADVLVE